MISQGLISRGSIFVATYSRANELDKFLESITSARGNLQIPLVVIHQVGFDDVEQVIQ